MKDSKLGRESHVMIGYELTPAIAETAHSCQVTAAHPSGFVPAIDPRGRANFAVMPGFDHPRIAEARRVVAVYPILKIDD